MPKLTLGDSEVTIIKWLKTEGHAIQIGDDLLEIETDKTNMTVQASVDGTLSQIIKQAGESVSPGELVALLIAPGGVQTTDGLTINDDKQRRLQSEPKEPSRGDVLQRLSSSAPLSSQVTVEHGELGGLRRSNVARPTRKFAASSGVSPRARSTISRLMIESATIPQFAVTRDVEVGEIVERVSAAREISLSDVIVMALRNAARAHPTTNSLMVDRVPQPSAEVNIAYAVETSRGLVAPVIRGLDSISLSELADIRRDLIDRARRGGLRPEDIEGATITLSNVGPLGAHSVTPLITPPQVAAVGVGAVRGKGQNAVMTVTFVGDHRAIDGADGARFLAALEAELQTVVVREAADPPRDL